MITVSLLGSLERQERETVGDEAGPDEVVLSSNLSGN